ncbi:hypothetical protein QN397_09510 [Variovorax sp. RTB1]|nr:hypothetical protein [Variovorax sp. RTB1]
MPTPQARLCQALPALPRGLLTLGEAFRLLQWMVVAILAVSLPLQAVSASVTAVLGARHTHRAEVTERIVASDAKDSMSGWRDFRRMQYSNARSHSHDRAEAQAEAHEHAHALGLRHHHQLDDTSVILDDAFDFADRGDSTDTAQASASFVFMAASNDVDLLPPPEAFGKAWRAARSVAPGSADPWRIERPPQALST